MIRKWWAENWRLLIVWSIGLAVVIVLMTRVPLL